MFYGYSEADLLAILIYGIGVNFLFLFLFGNHMIKNIGIQEVVRITSNRKPSFLTQILIFIPFAKMFKIVFSAYKLQFFYIKKGRSYSEFLEENL